MPYTFNALPKTCSIGPQASYIGRQACSVGPQACNSGPQACKWSGPHTWSFDFSKLHKPFVCIPMLILTKYYKKDYVFL